MATDLRTAEVLPPHDWDSDVRKFYEVVDGEFVQKPGPWVLETILSGLLLGLMGSFARTNGLGYVVTRTLFTIDRARVLMRRPTLAVVSEWRWPLECPVPATESWDVVPDLAAEIINHATSADEVAIKIEEYFQASVRAIWVIFPVTKKIYVYGSPTRVRILQIGDVLEGEDLLPGFQVALSTLFKERDEGLEGQELTAQRDARLPAAVLKNSYQPSTVIDFPLEPVLRSTSSRTFECHPFPTA